MFSEIARQKRLKKREVLAKDQSSEQKPGGSSEVSPSDDAISGVLLKEFCAQYQLSQDEVWRQIRSGQLIARTENGFVYVYGNQPPQQFPQDVITQIQLRDNLPTTELPELPKIAEANDGSARVALLLDYLTLAKEENRKILQISQDSIDKISKLSENIIAMKDEVIVEKEKTIEAKQAEIAALKDRIAQEQHQQVKLRQEMEDLQMLTETLLKDNHL